MKIAIFYQGTADAMGSAISTRTARLPTRGRSVSSPPQRLSLTSVGGLPAITVSVSR